MARLDVDQIVAAAWKVIDDSGLAAFTVRTVAEALNISAMAMYHYVPNKAALAKLMVEAANSERPLAPLTGDWQEDLWQQALWLRETHIAHPSLSMLHRQYRVWSPGLLRIAERWVTLWQQSGLDNESALVAARTSSQAIVGLVGEQTAHVEPPSEELLAWAPTTRVMFTKDHCQHRLYELAVRSIIEGLYARLSARPFDVVMANSAV